MAGFTAPTIGSASSRLRNMKGPAALAPKSAGFALQPPGMPITTTTGTQKLDPYKRLITTGPGGMQPGMGADGMFSSGHSGFGPTTVEIPPPWMGGPDPSNMMGRNPAPRAAAPPAGNMGDVPLSQFKPDAVPREPPMTAPPREVGKGPEDRAAAESAAFARAAERIANIGKGNLTGLRNQMTRRGISSSGMEAKGIADVQNNTAGQLGEVVRDQAIEGLRREQQIDDRDLASNVQQRGQDIGVNSTNYGGGITQRGQDMQQADWKMRALPSVLALMRMKSGAVA